VIALREETTKRRTETRDAIFVTPSSQEPAVVILNAAKVDVISVVNKNKRLKRCQQTGLLSVVRFSKHIWTNSEVDDVLCTPELKLNHLCKQQYI
jgi:hypothetical protein